MSTAAQQMLDRVLGPGHAVVRVNAELDYAATETTSQTYVSASGVPPLSPRPPRARSTTVPGRRRGRRPGPDLAHADRGRPARATAALLQERADRGQPRRPVVTKAQGAPGAVKRLTVSVVLDAAKAGRSARTRCSRSSRTPSGSTRSAATRSQVSNAAVRHDGRPGGRRAARRRAGRRAQPQDMVELGKKAGIGLLVLLVLTLGWRRSRRETRVDATASDLPASGNVLLEPRGAGRHRGRPAARARRRRPRRSRRPLAARGGDLEAAARRDEDAQRARAVRGQPAR